MCKQRTVKRRNFKLSKIREINKEVIQLSVSTLRECECYQKKKNTGPWNSFKQKMNAEYIHTPCVLVLHEFCCFSDILNETEEICKKMPRKTNQVNNFCLNVARHRGLTDADVFSHRLSVLNLFNICWVYLNPRRDCQRSTQCASSLL